MLRFQIFPALCGRKTLDAFQSEFSMLHANAICIFGPGCSWKRPGAILRHNIINDVGNADTDIKTCKLIRKDQLFFSCCNVAITDIVVTKDVQTASRTT